MVLYYFVSVLENLVSICANFINTICFKFLILSANLIHFCIRFLLVNKSVPGHIFKDSIFLFAVKKTRCLVFVQILLFVTAIVWLQAQKLQLEELQRQINEKRQAKAAAMVARTSKEVESKQDGSERKVVHFHMFVVQVAEV
jgi:hypothetical protein